MERGVFRAVKPDIRPPDGVGPPRESPTAFAPPSCGRAVRAGVAPVRADGLAWYAL